MLAYTFKTSEKIRQVQVHDSFNICHGSLFQKLSLEFDTVHKIFEHNNVVVSITEFKTVSHG